MNGMFLSMPLILLGAFVCGLGLVWYYRVITLAENFLKSAAKILTGAQRRKPNGNIFYRKDELSGSYKGRDVVVGIEHAGLKGEFMALPHIQMQLKDTIEYNLNRLPHYAMVDKRTLIYKVKINVLWGIFDRNYPQVFSQSYLIMSLERLLASAEDLERARTPKEIKF